MKSFTADVAVPHIRLEVKELMDSDVTLKLLEMGIMPGKILTLLHVAPFGDPLAFQLDESMIALRKNEAKIIRVVSLESSL